MTLVIGKVATDGAVLVADRMVSAGTHVLGTADKIVDLPDGSAVGVAGNQWSCEQVMGRLRTRPVQSPVLEHVLGVLAEVRQLPHPAYGGESGEVIPSVKAILLSNTGDGPKLYWSRRTQSFQQITSTYVIGDIDSDASPLLGGRLDSDHDCLAAIRLCWLTIRAFEVTAPSGGIGLCGEMVDARFGKSDGIRKPTESEVHEMHQAVEAAISELGTS